MATPADPQTDAAPEAAAPPKRKRAPASYRTRRWAGHPKYACELCSYDTLDPKDLEVHLRLSHERAIRIKPRKD